MKIVNFTAGLGNQIFEYIFVEYLKTKYPKHRIYGYYNPKRLNKHNGLEVENVFDITLPPHSWWSDFVAWLCRKLNGIGVKGVKSTDKDYNEYSIYFDGWWQNKRFYLDTLKGIKFRTFVLDEINSQLLHDIQMSQSVFIHIRRGDYLAPEHIAQYGGICTEEYYRKGIEIIQKHFDSPSFFVFSNDIDWVKNNMEIPNATYIDNNKGKNSYIDLYLMSNCKGSILANSSFSYWGALLNKNNPIVVFPKKWFNTHTPNIFPSHWFGL